MKWKRPLYLFHRWAGILLCAFFALWFISGIFMMYVEFPQLSLPERRVASPTLDFSTARLTPGQAVAALRQADFATVGTPSRNQPLDIEAPAAPLSQVDSLRLAMLLGRPLYVVASEGPAQARAVFADSGERLDTIDAVTAVRVAEDFAHRAGLGKTRARYLDQLQTDQWTVSAGLNAHRPLHKIGLDDAAGTELYVSSVTGEVVRDSTRIERWLNYPAAVTHWLYPTVIRRYPDAWAWMVDVLSSAGTVLAVSGLWIGLLRWKRRRKPGKSAIPYQGLMRWHHLSGLLFGSLVLTWVFSGLLSMNPGKLIPPRSISPEQAQIYSGKPLTPADFAIPDFSKAAIIDAESMHYDGRPYWRVTPRHGHPRLIAGHQASGALPDMERMRSRAAQLLPSATLAAVERLDDYDDYYYTRHPEYGSHPLPILRVRFADDDRSWFHLDPVTGRIISRSTRINRLYRWLYNGLHSWDIRWLWERRPLWDIAVIGGSLGGLALSLTGVIAGWRRLRYDARPRVRKASRSPHRVSSTAPPRPVQPDSPTSPISASTGTSVDPA